MSNASEIDSGPLIHVSWHADQDFQFPDDELRPMDYVRAARVPKNVVPQSRGAWTIQRVSPGIPYAVMVGFSDYTLLHRLDMAGLHKELGEVVMEDSRYELLRHMAIWLAASGRVLVTGLGLGCVVRGLLAKPAVAHIDVVEIDPDIVAMIGPEFAAEPRVAIHTVDALEWPIAGRRWDYAWHDIWCDDADGALQRLHMKLFLRYFNSVQRQGAWAFPRELRRLLRRKHPGRFL